MKNFTNKLSDTKTSYLDTYLTGKNILDVGAGTGHYSAYLAHQDPTRSILALDHLAHPHNPLFTYQQVDLEQKLTLPAGQFSTILAFDIIEHIAHEQELLAELCRVCAPEGILIGSAPHDNDLFLPDYNLTFYHRSDVTHKRYYTPEILHTNLTKAGFVVTTIDLHGGANPQVIAEFFPHALKWPVKKLIGLLRRLRIINTKKLHSDLFFVAQKPA